MPDATCNSVPANNNEPQSKKENHMRKAYWFLGHRLTIIAGPADTEGRYDLVEAWVPPGTQVPLHRHRLCSTNRAKPPKMRARVCAARERRMQRFYRRRIQSARERNPSVRLVLRYPDALVGGGWIRLGRAGLGFGCWHLSFISTGVSRQRAARRRSFSSKSPQSGRYVQPAVSAVFSSHRLAHFLFLKRRMC